MKKTIAFLILIFSFFLSKAQYPVPQSIGTDSALVTSKGGLKGRIVVWNFTDTAQANQQRIKDYAGAMIFTQDALWFRDSSRVKWVQIIPSASPTADTLYWKIGGNFNIRALGGVIGTKDSSDFLMMTKDLKRLGISARGILDSNSNVVALGIDTTTGYLSYARTSGGSTTPDTVQVNFPLYVIHPVAGADTIAVDTITANIGLATKHYSTYPDSIIFSNQNVYTPPTSYKAFGNSITLGPPFCTADSVYPARIAALTGLPITNYAVGGTGIWYSVKQANTNINVNHTTLETMMAGFNDLRRGGNNPLTYKKIVNALNADWLNHFAATSLPANGGDASIVKSGIWFDYGAASVGGKYSNGAFTANSGDYIEWTFSGSAFGVGLIAFDSLTYQGSAFHVDIDGTLYGNYSENAQTDGIYDGSYDNGRTQMALIVSGLSNGSHTVRLTSDQSVSYFAVDYFATLASIGTYPALVWFTPPYMTAAGYASGAGTNHASNGTTDSITAKMDSLKLALPTGYQHYIVPTNNYYDTTTGTGGDGIHPNDLGQRQIFNGYQATIPALTTFRNNTLLVNQRPYFIYNGTPQELAFSSDIHNTTPSSYIQNQTATTQSAAYKINGISSVLNQFNVGNSSISDFALRAQVATNANIFVENIGGAPSLSSLNDARSSGTTFPFYGSAYNFYKRLTGVNTLLMSLGASGDLETLSDITSDGALHAFGSVAGYAAAGFHAQYNSGQVYLDAYGGGSNWRNMNLRAANFTFANSGATALTLSGGAAQLNTYGSGTHTGTPAYSLQVDASGNIIEGSTGGGGLSSSNFVYNEEFTGSTSSTYTLANTPVTGKLTVYKNGTKLPLSEFSLTGAIVTLTSPRVSGDVFSNDYIK